MSDLASVFIVEDHPVTMRGTVALVGERFDVVGTADNVGDAIELIVERDPDLVLLDVNLPGGGGAAVIKGVRAIGARAKFLAFTVLTNRSDVVHMLSVGVDGYATKASEESEVLDGIDSVLAGGRWLSRDVAGYVLDIDEDVTVESGLDRLTPRERQVTERIATGDTYRECAARLGMSVKTLENHMDHIFRKLEVQSRHELTTRVFEEGFFRPDDRLEGTAD